MKYRKQISLGYDASGRQIRKWISADSKTELKQKILRYRMELEQVENPSDITFEKYSDQWIQTYKANRAKQTQEMYIYALRKCEELNPVPVKKITKSMCQQIVNESWDHPSSARNIVLTLKQIFKTAAADGIIATNPASSLSLPKKPQSKFYLLTKEDLEKVKNAPLNESDRLLVTILQVFGLRPAEALALQPNDFDWKNGVLRITKAVELANDNRGRIKNTKTDVSRDIPIPEELSALLREQIRAIKSVFLFTKADGGLYTKSAYRRMSERVHKAVNEVIIADKLKELEKADKLTKEKEAQIRATNYIPEFSLYSFRHRRATDLYYLTQTTGLSTKKAAYLMGHSEIIFLKTYSHVDEDLEAQNIYKNFDFKAI